MEKIVIRTEKAPAPFQGAPYNQAIRAGDFLFVSGQIPLDPATGQIVPGGIVEQTHQVLKNLGAVLAAAGVSYARVVKTTVFLADMGEFGAMNEVYGEFVTARTGSGVLPARTTVITGLPRAEMLVEIDALAVL